MGRQAEGYWDGRSKRYYARLGDFSEKTGKRRALMLLHPDGRPIAYGENSAVAAAVQRRLAEIDASERRREGPTVADITQAFLDWQRAQGAAPGTIKTHLFHLEAFCDFAGDGRKYGERAASSITVADLTTHRRAMEAKGNQTGYLKIRYSSILACWHWAARPVEGRDPVKILAVNPFEGLARPKRGRGRNQALPWPFTRLLLQRAWGLAKAHPYHRKLDRDAERVKILRTRYMAMTGCRPDEAARLKWSELDLDRRIATMVGKTTSRTGRLRRISIPVSLAKGLARLARWDGRHPDYVFSIAKTPKISPPSGRNSTVWFAELRGKLIASGLPLGPNVTLYWLRHDWQSFGLEVESVEGVSAAAGNSPQVLLSTYEHTVDRRIREVSDKIDEARRRRGRLT